MSFPQVFIGIPDNDAPARIQMDHALIQQLHMVLESYKAEANKRLDEIYKKQNLQSQIKIQKNDSKNS